MFDQSLAFRFHGVQSLTFMFRADPVMTKWRLIHVLVRRHLHPKARKSNSIVL